MFYVLICFSLITVAFCCEELVRTGVLAVRLQKPSQDLWQFLQPSWATKQESQQLWKASDYAMLTHEKVAQFTVWAGCELCELAIKIAQLLQEIIDEPWCASNARKIVYTCSAHCRPLAIQVMEEILRQASTTNVSDVCEDTLMCFLDQLSIDLDSFSTNLFGGLRRRDVSNAAALKRIHLTPRWGLREAMEKAVANCKTLCKLFVYGLLGKENIKEPSKIMQNISLALWNEQ